MVRTEGRQAVRRSNFAVDAEMSIEQVSAAEALGRYSSLLRMLGNFYDLPQALAWCETPQAELFGQRPVVLLATKDGAEKVAAVLQRLIDGAHS